MAEGPPVAPLTWRDHMTAHTWAYGLRLMVRQIGRHQVTDMAATMTYYLVLSVFPLLLALVSLFSLVGRADRLVPIIEETLSAFMPAEVTDFFTPIISGFLTSQGATLVLVLGLVTALWSASNYVGAFIRAMNRVFGVREGRPFVTVRLIQYAMTVILAICIALLGTAIVMSNTAARWLGDLIGLGDQFVTFWLRLRLPLIGVLGAGLLATLYFFTPNVRRPPRRLASIGAVIAVALSTLIGWGFTFYLDVFNGANNYTRTYGALAGVIIVLIMLWLVNIMILVGAELDATLERIIELRQGLDATAGLLLPVRNGRRVRRGDDGRTALVNRASNLRDVALESGATPSPWYAANATDPGLFPGSDWQDSPGLWRWLDDHTEHSILPHPRRRRDDAAPAG